MNTFRSCLLIQNYLQVAAEPSLSPCLTSSFLVLVYGHWGELNINGRSAGYEPKCSSDLPWHSSGGLVTDLSPKSPEFSPSALQVEFVVEKVVLRQVFLRVIQFPLPIIIPSIIMRSYDGPTCGGSAKGLDLYPTLSIRYKIRFNNCREFSTNTVTRLLTMELDN
jgi:hypothetical protein